MKRKQIVSLLTTVILLIGSLAGCGSSTGNTSASSDSATESASGTTASQSSTESGGNAASGSSTGITGSMTYNMFMRSQYVTWLKDQKWYDEAEKRTGVTVNYINGPEESDDVYSEIDQRVVSKTLEDANMVQLSQAKLYGEQGAFVDLKPYIEKYAPDYQKYINDNPEYASYITASDGGIYGLVKETPTLADLIGYRADHFEKAGIDPSTVVTVDDFTEALRKLKKYYGADNPNYYPLTGRDTALRFAAWFGASASIDADGGHGIYYNHEKDGNFDIRNENCYKMVETMKTWYDEGLINPQWVAGTFSEGDWESAMLNGDGSVFYDFYTRPQWFMDNGGPDADPDYQMAVLDFLKDENGNTLPVTQAPKWQDSCATAVSSACNEDTIATILGFINYFYTEEGLTLASWGVEGESYEVQPDGSKKFIDGLYHQEESKPDGEKKWSFLSDRFTVCKPVDNTAFYSWNEKLISDACNQNIKEENLQPVTILNYTSEELEELSTLVASVYEAEVAGLTQFINGTTELNEENWKSFINNMDDLGLSRIEAIELEAYNNTKG